MAASDVQTREEGERSEERGERVVKNKSTQFTLLSPSQSPFRSPYLPRLLHSLPSSPSLALSSKGATSMASLSLSLSRTGKGVLFSLPSLALSLPHFHSRVCSDSAERVRVLQLKKARYLFAVTHLLTLSLVFLSLALPLQCLSSRRPVLSLSHARTTALVYLLLPHSRLRQQTSAARGPEAFRQQSLLRRRRQKLCEERGKEQTKSDTRHQQTRVRYSRLTQDAFTCDTTLAHCLADPPSCSCGGHLADSQSSHSSFPSLASIEIPSATLVLVTRRSRRATFTSREQGRHRESEREGTSWWSG